MSNRVYGTTFVVYPESFDISAFATLEASRVPFAYAVHDRDVDECGELKKAHIHVYVQGKLTDKQKEFLVSKGCPNHFEPVRSDSGMWDYLIHVNHGDKFQYSRDDVIMSRDFVPELIGNPKKKADNYCVQIIGLINLHNIVEYIVLVDLLLEMSPIDEVYCELFTYATGKGRQFCIDYLKSRLFARRTPRIDPVIAHDTLTTIERLECACDD